MPQRRTAKLAGDAGLTLVELLVGMVIVTILAVSSVSGWTRYQRTVEHRGTAQELVSALRNAQQRSLAEAAAYCISFSTSDRSYEVRKGSCATGTLAKPATRTQSTRVSLAAPTFLQTNGTTTSNLSFFARGSATKGSVQVRRAGSAKKYTITVEGLTGRVSLLG